MRGRRLACHTILACLVIELVGRSAACADLPSWLPRYDLKMRVEVDAHRVVVCERVTWFNRQARPAAELVFNAHAHYAVPADEVGKLAKMVEILRLAPSDSIDVNGPPLQVEKVALVNGLVPNDPASGVALPFLYRSDNSTALEVRLPSKVRQNEGVTVELTFTLRLPQRQGRWGQWEGVTFLAQWLPVLAVYDESGWQPTPFIPWHQPFFNEAGIYTARIALPINQRLACSGSIVGQTDLGDGWKTLEVRALGVRDFAVICSARFREYSDQVGPVRVHCLAFPEHEFYALHMLRIVAEALPVYRRWFGPYAYPEFTVVESYFGWNGNECGALVMVDVRIFAMPHGASRFVDELVSHELCHQWWYNCVGTNGYSETWMDEGLATYFAHRLMDTKYGRNNALLNWPSGLEWLPNIQREDYRYATLVGAVARGEASPTVQDLPKFKNLVRLIAMTYDRGGKIVGMIADRLGEDGFFDFMSVVYSKYQYRILRVADFQRELEAYTGRSWQTFFDNWLYGKGMTDWKIESVRVQKHLDANPQSQVQIFPGSEGAFLAAVGGTPPAGPQPCRVTVMLRQSGEYTEQTVVGFCLDASETYQVRLPIVPQVPVLEIQDPPARVEVLPDNRVRVEVELPCEPTQVSVDPDQVLLDRDPTNNHWKTRVRWRITPVYTQFDEVDLTNAYDRWNVIFGPWLYASTYTNPWYTRSEMAGLRAGVYRTQDFSGGAYLGYRSNDRNVVAGVDALWDHWPWPNTQVGLNAERSLTTWAGEGDERASRAVLFGRYILLPGSSFYLPPFEYVEAFGAVESNPLPTSGSTPPGADPFDQQTLAGLHYHKNLLTPYWDPEGGMALDVTAAEGLPVLGEHGSFQEVFGQASFAKTVRALFHLGEDRGFLGWLGDTRLATRAYIAVAQPDDAEIFTLGGGELFRGYDLNQRQGSIVWIGSLEWRMPLVQRLDWDMLDHFVGVRNLYAAPFYDVGDAYINGKQTGPIAHAVGFGLRIDIAWFSLIERSIVRFDVAKTVNDDTPVQFWFGLSHPF